MLVEITEQEAILICKALDWYIDARLWNIEKMVMCSDLIALLKERME